MATFGLLWHGPSGHYFYGFLDRMLPGTSMQTVFQKVGIDQIAWNPIFGVVFFTSLGLMEGKSTDQIQDKIKADLPTAVTGSWAYWVPAHFVNFRFIPGEQRLLYINGARPRASLFRAPPRRATRAPQACRSCTTSSSRSSATRTRPRTPSRTPAPKKQASPGGGSRGRRLLVVRERGVDGGLDVGHELVGAPVLGLHAGEDLELDALGHGERHERGRRVPLVEVAERDGHDVDAGVDGHLEGPALELLERAVVAPRALGERDERVAVF